MPLSRLDNFLKNARGNILYVNPNDLDATDSIENQGNSLARPFKTIQRALAEAARFSYQSGLDNDRFGKTTILLYPGEHIVDNRPGWIPDGSGNFKLRNGTTSSDFPAWSLTTNYDLTTANNALYKLNSVHGGVILPRGTSIVGLDLRKTKIRPKYAPNPENDNIERSALFRVTGACYLWQFSIFDGDPNGTVYKDYTDNVFVPNFSHHKLSCFEYADGVNDVKINDNFITNFDAGRTDLDMYYEKIGLAYGSSSGRAIEPDYPSSGLDIQPKIDEFRIVGPTAGSIGITSIKAGDGVTASDTITVTLSEGLSGLSVDTAIQINDIGVPGYNGKFTVSDVLAVDNQGTTQFKYNVSNAPTNALPSTTGSTVSLEIDTVGSASPYIFNISLRSVFGMCGCLSDGSKADGFKSMVIAQFTGIGLQKDPNAFVKYDSTSGEYKDTTFAGNENIQSDSRAVFKPSYQNFHIKTINDAYIQNVSIFAIGYAEQFASDTGGDQSINNSNSNFGAKAIVAEGFKAGAFPQDDVGYITHIIPPKELETSEVAIEFNAIDVEKTVVGVASTSRLYLYNQLNEDVVPDSVIEGYRIGARINDELKVLIADEEYKARIVMPNTELASSSEQSTQQKQFSVGRSAGINSISSNTLTLKEPHNLLSGESVRIVAENGHLPDGLESNKIYFAITSGVGTDEVKLAKTFNESVTGDAVTINNKGGILEIQSRVSDKISGDIGHPIQFDSNEGQWYITVGTAATDNSIYSTLVGLGTTALGAATPRTFVKRQPDTRSVIDTTYRARYVIPSGTGISTARAPIDGFVLQESGSVTGASDAEVAKYYSTTSATLDNLNELRNFNFLAHAHWTGNTAYYLSELPHGMKVGSEVEVKNVKSTNNPVGVAKSGFNGTFVVTGVSSAREFVVSLASVTGPGTFTSDTNARTTSLPTFNQKKFKGTYSVYRAQEVQEYLPGIQDGVYNLIVTNNSNSPTVAPFSTERFSQNVQFLYPQTNRDNPVSDPKAASSFATPALIGQVVVDEPQNSITKETLEKTLTDFNVGFGITMIESNAAGTAHTIYTDIDHGLNRVLSVGIANSGVGYGNGSAGTLYNAKLVSAGAATTQGQHATARLSVNSSGNITAVKIMDGGSAYEIGDSLQVVGVGTTAPHTVGIVTVTNVYDNTNDVLSLSGVVPNSNSAFNTLYRITGIATDSAKRITVSSASTIGAATTLGVGVTDTANATAILTGEVLDVTAFNYNQVTGVGVVTTAQTHGLRVDNAIRLDGADSPLYRGDFIIKKVNNQTSFNISVGVGTTTPGTSGTLRAYQYGIDKSAGGNVTFEVENLAGRQSTVYAGVTTSLAAPILTASTTSVQISDIGNTDIEIGDYLSIDAEIVRVKTTVTSGTLTVFRGVLGTRAAAHASGALVRRVTCRPVEFRRNSIIRASGHTFEYVGFGPGNYSTAFPSKQNRSLSVQEEFLAQATKRDGGISVYTGMNDKGDFFVGNKKVSSATGQEEVFDSPIPTVTGEDISGGGFSVGFDVLTPLEATISRSIKVEGGADGNIISEFDGPVVFNQKVTSTSTKGMEASSLFLQGDATVSRKYTVGIATPALAGNPGDISYRANPSAGGYLGWVYTTNNDWYRFGAVSLVEDQSVVVFDKVGIGTTTPGLNTLQVGAGASLFSVDGTGVGIGTTANGYALQVIGNTNVVGTVTATTFIGDGSNLTNLANDSLWQGVASGLGTGIYPINNHRVGIGTTVPHYPLHAGSAGAGTTDLFVQNNSEFAGRIDAQDIIVGGAITATSYRLDSSTSNINAGIVTAANIVVGSSGTALQTTGGFVGVGTATPRAKLDVEGAVKLKTYSEYVETLDISSGNVNVDLSVAQSFTLTVDEAVTQFTLLNPPSGATAFSILITQDSTGYSVGIGTFKDSGGSAISVKFPGGGVLPIVTTTASKSDIYSFKTFDGGSTLFGVVGGQNFA